MRVWNTGVKVRSRDNVWHSHFKMWISVSLAHGPYRNTLSVKHTKCTVLRQEFQFPHEEASKQANYPRPSTRSLYQNRERNKGVTGGGGGVMVSVFGCCTSFYRKAHDVQESRFKQKVPSKTRQQDLVVPDWIPRSFDLLGECQI